MKRRRPAVSVLICTRDKLAFLRQAVASVRAQTFTDYELIVVDDASSDGTSRWAAGQRGLRCVRLKRNAGPAGARNLALSQARASLVAFLDHDDLWRPSFLERLRSALAGTRALAAYCDHAVIDARGRVVSARGLRLPRNAHPAFTALTGLRSVPQLSCALLRKEAFGRRRFDEGFRLVCDDVDFFYRLALARGGGAFRFVDEPLAAYRRYGALQTSFTTRAADAADPEAWFRAQLGRWAALKPRQRERLMDVVYFHRKHASWIERVLPGRSQH